jgi:hypothetical protein
MKRLQEWSRLEDGNVAKRKKGLKEVKQQGPYLSTSTFKASKNLNSEYMFLYS